MAETEEKKPGRIVMSFRKGVAEKKAAPAVPPPIDVDQLSVSGQADIDRELGAELPTAETFVPQQRMRNVQELLATMPLALLLPDLGDLADVELNRKTLDRRLEILREMAAEPGFEMNRGQSAEMAMLQQIANWLSVRGSDRS